jgi:hypothetical protein
MRGTRIKPEPRGTGRSASRPSVALLAIDLRTDRRFGRDRGRSERYSLWAHRCQLAGRTPFRLWTFASGGSQHPSGSSREDRHQWSGPGQGGRAMKRVVVDRFGGPEVLKVVEDDDPRPGPGEVRVICADMARLEAYSRDVRCARSVRGGGARSAVTCVPGWSAPPGIDDQR